MAMSAHAFPKQRPHPMLLIAGVAIILFSAVGIAAIMGWIPTSIGSNTNNSGLMQPDHLAAPAKQIAKTVPHQPSAAPAHRDKIRAESSHAAVTSSKSMCSNCGVVESTREITTRASGTGVGAAGGAVVGGLLGNQVGGGHGKEVMTVVGAIGGAVAGNQIEGQIKAVHSYDITVRLDDGSIRVINQATQPGWHAGDRVKIVDDVVRSNG